VPVPGEARTHHEPFPARNVEFAGRHRVREAGAAALDPGSLLFDELAVLLLLLGRHGQAKVEEAALAQCPEPRPPGRYRGVHCAECDPQLRAACLQSVSRDLQAKRHRARRHRHVRPLHHVPVLVYAAIEDQAPGVFDAEVVILAQRLHAHDRPRRGRHARPVVVAGLGSDLDGLHAAFDAVVLPQRLPGDQRAAVAMLLPFDLDGRAEGRLDPPLAGRASARRCKRVLPRLKGLPGGVIQIGGWSHLSRFELGNGQNRQIAFFALLTHRLPLRSRPVR